MTSMDGLVRELDDAAGTFARGELGPARARKVRETGCGFDRTVLSRMGEMGWLGILVPEVQGGLGLGVMELSTVARRLAGALLPEPLTTCAAIAATALVACDSEALQRELLPGLCTGELLPTVAWQERAGDLEGASVEAAATERAGGWELSGTKLHVAYAGVADGFIVSARTHAGVSLFWVPSSASGILVSPERLADGTVEGTVRFERSPAQRMHSHAGERVLARALDIGRVCASAELLGVATASLDITLQYMRTRTQFGKPIGSFQALQHRAVDLFMLTELATSSLQQAVLRLESRPDDAARGAAASHVKARCSEMALEVVRESIQMHGAIGWTDECDVSLYVKRALVLSASLGNAAAHRRRFARLSPFTRSH